MKVVWLAVFVTITSTLAHAEDMADMISRYRREHGLSTVKTDPQLTAIAERQAKAIRLRHHGSQCGRVVCFPDVRRAYGHGG